MLRSVLPLLLLSASCAASATETAACDPTSDDTCKSQDYQSVLQNRMQYEMEGVDAGEQTDTEGTDRDQETDGDEETDANQDEEDEYDEDFPEEEEALEQETEEEEEPPSDTEEAPGVMAEEEAEAEDEAAEDLTKLGRCDEKGDEGCCFTKAGAAFALKKKKVPKGTKEKMCAYGAKEYFPKWWKRILKNKYVVKCEDKNACTKQNLERLHGGLRGKAPKSGLCADYQCRKYFKDKDDPPKGKVCTTVAECENNCCQVDINARKNEKTEILTFSTIMVLKNATAITADLDVEDGNKTIAKKHDFGKDVKALKDAWAGLCKVMKQTKTGRKLCKPKHIFKMKTCIHLATCIIEKNVDYDALKRNKKQLQTYTLLVELYDKFEGVAWDKMMLVLKKEKIKGTSKGDFVSPKELACSGLKKLRKHAKGPKSFMEADNEEQEAAYRVSAVLVASAEKTHAVLDSHMANSSMDETVAALHRAWQAPCEMLDCDHTNYWDLLGASHRHSLALIEAGASAHHMRVHVGVRARLEHRIQIFLGSDGNLFADRIIRSSGTRTEAFAQAYADSLFEAAREMWTEHPKKYGVSPLLLSLVPREQMLEQAKTDLQKQAVQNIMDDNFIIASKKATLYHMMEERGLSVSYEEPDVDEEEEVPFSLLERSSHMDRSLGRKGFVRAFESLGKGIVSVGRAIGGAVVTAFTRLNQAIVTVATAIGNVINAFVDFVLSLFSCMGFGVTGSVGYSKAFGGPPPAPQYVKIVVSGSVSEGLGGLLNNQGSAYMSVAFNVALTVGYTMDVGISTGVGITAGIACGVNSITPGSGQASCTFSVGVGITASAAAPKGSDPGCIAGPVFAAVGRALGFKCVQSWGVTIKILCCNINLLTGCSSCGGGGCTDSTTGQASQEAQNAVAQNGAGAQRCDAAAENLSGNGAGYRGCQTQTQNGRTCQKWSAQQPHTHSQCGQTTQTLNGQSSRGSTIRAVHANRCLDAPERNRNGGRVHLWDCDANNLNQQWRYTASNQGQIKLVHGKCLDAPGRNENGGGIHIWDCSPNNHNQQWSVSGQQIRIVHGKCLDKGDHNRNGQHVHMWDCSINNQNQQWEISGNTGNVWCESDADTNRGLGDHNLCRNPSGQPTIWCYTTDSNKRWENCSPRETFVKLRYPSVNCPDGYNAANETECRNLPGFTFHGTLRFDPNWIDGCFEQYSGGRGGSNQNTRRLWYNRRPGATTGRNGGNRLCSLLGR